MGKKVLAILVAISMFAMSFSYYDVAYAYEVPSETSLSDLLSLMNEVYGDELNQDDNLTDENTEDAADESISAASVFDTQLEEDSEAETDEAGALSEDVADEEISENESGAESDVVEESLETEEESTEEALDRNANSLTETEDMPENNKLFGNGEIVTSGACGENLKYVLMKKGDGYSVRISGSGPMYDYSYNDNTPWSTLTVNEAIFEQGITKIGEMAFNECNLTSVSIPEGVIEIGNNAFCDNPISSVSFPESLEKIGFSFVNCCIKKLFIPCNVSSLDEYSFRGNGTLSEIAVDNRNICYDSRNNCNAIIDSKTNTLVLGSSNTVIPDTVVKIGANAFLDNTALTEITIPDSVQEFETSAFEGTGLRSVVIPDGVTEITYSMFNRCHNLVDITLPDSIVSFRHSAFRECPFNDLKIPESVQYIHDAVFDSCPNYKYPVLPKGLKRLGDSTGGGPFARSGVVSVDIPDGVTTLYFCAFKDCKDLESVKLPKNLKTIGWSAFEGCDKLRELEIPEGVTSIDRYAFKESGIESVNIPESVTTLGYGTLYKCKNLKMVDFRCKISVLNKNTFYDCESLRAITLPDTITTFEDSSSFGGNSSMEAISLSRNLKAIPANVFSFDRKLKKIFIPKAVESIGNNAFNYCESLSDIYYEGTAEDFKALAIGEKNDVLKKATIHYGSEKPDYSNYQSPEDAGIYTILVNVVGDGEVSPGLNNTVYGGESLRLEFTPGPFNVVYDVCIDGTSYGKMETCTFTDVDSDHEVTVAFEDSDYVTRQKYKEGKDISTDELFHEYSVYLQTNNSYEGVFQELYGSMSDNVAKMNADKFGNTMTAVSYCWKHPTDMWKWFFYADDIKEYDIQSSTTRDLILAIAGNESMVQEAVKNGKKEYKRIDRWTKIISSDLKDNINAADDEQIKALARELAEASEGDLSANTIYYYLTDAETYDWYSKADQGFKALGTVMDALDCLSLFYMTYITDRAITETLMEEVDKDSTLYEGLKNLHIKQCYPITNIGEAVGRFVLPFLEKAVTKGLHINNINNMIIGIFSGQAISGPEMEIAKLALYAMSEAMHFAGVRDLDDYLTANTTFGNVALINSALLKERQSVWNSGNYNSNKSTDELMARDSFLFYARDAAITKAYEAIKKISKGDDLEKLNKSYQKYCRVNVYESFILNCKSEARVGFEARKQVYIPVAYKTVSNGGNGAIGGGGGGGTRSALSSVLFGGVDDVNETKDLELTKVEGIYLSKVKEGGNIPEMLTIRSFDGNEKVIGIGTGLLAGRTDLTSVFLPDTVLEIEAEAFSGCCGLTSIYLSRYLEQIGSKAFSGCTSLTEIDIPVTVEYIADDAFDGTEAITIIGEAGSYAEAYAQDKANISFTAREKNVRKILSASYSKSSMTMDEPLNANYINLTVEYDDGTMGTVTEGYYCQFENKKIGENRVNIFYGDCNSSFSVYVVESECSYTVEFRNHLFEQIADSISGTANAGEMLTINAPFIEGYYVDEDTTRVQIGEHNDFVVTYSTYEELDSRDVEKEDVPANGMPTGLWVAGIEDVDYTGTAIAPAVKVYDGNRLLTKGNDYTISFKNNKNAYTYETVEEINPKKAPQCIIKMKGNYKNSRTIYFRIRPIALSEDTVSAENIIVQYNKKKQTPTPVVIWKGKKLKFGTDFTVKEYQAAAKDKTAFRGEAIGQTTYDLTIVGKGNFSGERQVTLTIVGSKTDSTENGLPVVMMSKVATTKIPSQIFDSEGITLEKLKDSKGNFIDFVVTYNRKKLTRGVDYDIEPVKNGDAVGTATMRIVGLHASSEETEAGVSFAGTKTLSFKITGYPMNKVTVAGIDGKGYPFTGDAVEPEGIRVTYKKDKNTVVDLNKDEEYNVEFRNNVKSGTATAIFTGKGSFTGTKKITFKIKPYAMNGDGIVINYGDTIEACYTKGGAVPELRVSFRGHTLKYGVDYTLKYSANNKIYSDETFATKGAPVVSVVGKGSFTGTRKENFLINKRRLDDGITMTAADKKASDKTGAYKSAPVLVDSNGKKLVAGKDYEKSLTYTYGQNAYVEKLEGKKKTRERREIGDLVDAKDIVPAGTIMRVHAKGVGPYEGTISAVYNIIKPNADISSAKFAIKSKEFLGNGTKVTLSESDFTSAVIGKTSLRYGVDYKIVSYTGNTKAGTAKVTLEGIGDYGGTKVVSFKIGARSLTDFWEGVFSRINRTFS